MTTKKFSLYTCPCLIILIFSAITPAVAAEKLGETEVNFYVNDFSINIKCPEHASVFIDDNGPYHGENIVRQEIIAGKNITIKYIPDNDYKITDVKYSINATVSKDENAIVFSNIQSAGEVSATSAYIGEHNPLTYDESYIRIWIPVFISTGIAFMILAKQLLNSSNKVVGK